LRNVPKKWRVIGVVVAVVLAVVGLVEGAREPASLFHGGHPSKQQHAQAGGQLTVVKDASKAGFEFMAPMASNDWKFDAQSPVFDSAKGVVNYQVKLANGTNVTISQQQMPAELTPWQSSAKFNQFILNSNVAFSQAVGEGKAYFRAAMTNGHPANGATVVIFATDGVLMFGQAGDVLPYDKWTKLLAAMKPVKSQ
jgi:hypothetical protein